jgi:hypothetical protein
MHGSGTEEEVSPEFAALIDAHRKAWDFFGTTCDWADRCSPEYRGIKGEEARDAAYEAEEAAMARVAAWPAIRRADQRAKGEWFRWVDDECGGLGGYADAIIAVLVETNAPV